MLYVCFIGLGIAGFVGAYLWRRKIVRKHTEFCTKVEQASDVDQAKRLYQVHLKKNQQD